MWSVQFNVFTIYNMCDALQERVAIVMQTEQGHQYIAVVLLAESVASEAWLEELI